MATSTPPTVETIRPPADYPLAQIYRAVRIALLVGRGRFVYCELPWSDPS